MKSEIRSFEIRAVEDRYQISGIAAAYNVRSKNLGGFIEVIASGAFSRSLKAGVDVKCLFNHDPSKILGRTKSGTLKLSDSPEGLRFVCQLDKSNTDHQAVFASVKRGDVNECSFAFLVPDGGDTWQDGAKDDDGNPCRLRVLKDVDLMDVSVVTYPAYAKGTSASARNATQHDSETEAWRNRVKNRLKELDRLFENGEKRRQDEARAAMHGYVAARLEKIAANERQMAGEDVVALGRKLREALREEGLVYSCHDSESCVGIDPFEDEENCGYRYLYGVADDGSVALVDESRTRVRHQWTSDEVSSIRQGRDDFETAKRMRSAAGIFHAEIDSLGFFIDRS
jgi:uncharacterized protein